MRCETCGQVLNETITREISVTLDDEHPNGAVSGDGESDADIVTYECLNPACPENDL